MRFETDPPGILRTMCAAEVEHGISLYNKNKSSKNKKRKQAAASSSDVPKKPRGRPPKGKVWSEGGWVPMKKPQPRGRPPNGKVWSGNGWVNK